jgi:hypothetical protein
MFSGVHLICGTCQWQWFCPGACLRHELIIIFLQLLFWDSFRNCLDYIMIMMFSGKLVNNKDVDNSCF